MKKFVFASAILLTGTLAFGQILPEKLQGAVSGRVYFDGTAFFKDKTHLGSGATISDLRLGVSGKYGDFTGKIDIGFAKKGVSLKDIFMKILMPEWDILQNRSVLIIWKVRETFVLLMPDV